MNDNTSGTLQALICAVAVVATVSLPVSCVKREKELQTEITLRHADVIRDAVELGGDPQQVKCALDKDRTSPVCVLRAAEKQQ